MTSSVQSSPRSLADTSDEELLARYCDAADVTAFETLVHRYERPIFSYLARYLRSATLAEEVFQDLLDDQLLGHPWGGLLEVEREALDRLKERGVDGGRELLFVFGYMNFEHLMCPGCDGAHRSRGARCSRSYFW